MARIAAVGDSDVDCYEGLARMFPGGNCLNVSVFARRFGADTAYVGAIGDDAAGEAIRKALTVEGVVTDRLRILPGNTAHCVIGHREGDRVFLSADLGVSRFEPDEADFSYAASFNAVHIGQSSGLDAHLVRFAQGALLSYDFSTKLSHPRLDEIASRCFLASFSGSDLSDSEASKLMRRALKTGARWVLVTRGRRGAVLAGDGKMFEVAAEPCDVIDTLGAGDTFIAGTLVGLLSRPDEPEAFLAASAKGAALTCMSYGAIGHGVPLVLRRGRPAKTLG